MNSLIQDLLADGPLVILTFETGGETSKLTRKFIAELTATLMTAPKKPLVHASGDSLSAIYRAVPEWNYGLYINGSMRPLDFSDRRFADSRARLKISLVGAEEFTEAPDGAWHQDRTPETVARWQLPVLDDRVLAQSLEKIVDQWTSEGHVVVIQPERVQAYEPNFTTRPNLTPERDQDPMVRQANKVQAAYDAGRQ